MHFLLHTFRHLKLLLKLIKVKDPLVISYIDAYKKCITTAMESIKREQATQWKTSGCHCPGSVPISIRPLFSAMGNPEPQEPGTGKTTNMSPAANNVSALSCAVH